MDKPFYRYGDIDGRHCRIHLIYTTPLPIHEAYGLWICKTQEQHENPLKERERPQVFEHFSISHNLDAEGFLWHPDGTTQTVKPGQGILMCPGIVHNYGSDTSSYTEDSISFCGDIADRLYAHGILRPGIVNIGHDRRLLPIITCAADPTADAQLMANILLQKLLVDLRMENRYDRHDANIGHIQKLIEAIRANLKGSWSVPEMAAFCGLSITYFRSVFKDAVGTAPKTYVDQLRMEKARELLVNTDSNVATIANALGFTDALHFSKRFSTLTGVSPRKYRTLNRPPSPQSQH